MVIQRSTGSARKVDLVALVDHYTVHHRPGMNRYLDWFQKQTSLREAIVAAALSVDAKGNRFPQQQRLPDKALLTAKQRLSASAKSVGSCTSFQELFDRIGERLESAPDLGDRYAYDVALRLGVKLGFFPQKVYLHAGNRGVAKDIDPKYGSRSVQAMEVDAFPAPLRVLPAHELEDLISQYKVCLEGGCSPSEWR